jgi:hypothetical protein
MRTPTESPFNKVSTSQSKEITDQPILQDYTNLDIEKRKKRINEKLDQEKRKKIIYKKLGIKLDFNRSLPSISEENSIDDTNYNFTRSNSEGANPPPTPSNHLTNSDLSLAHQVIQNANNLQEKGSRFIRT